MPASLVSEFMLLTAISYHFLREASVESKYMGKRKLRWFMSVGLHFLSETGDKAS